MAVPFINMHARIEGESLKNKVGNGLVSVPFGDTVFELDVDVAAPDQRVRTSRIGIRVWGPTAIKHPGGDRKALAPVFETETFGTSVRHPEDEEDPTIGTALAVAGALERAAANIRRQAWGVISHRDGMRATNADPERQQRKELWLGMTEEERAEFMKEQVAYREARVKRGRVLKRIADGPR